MINKWIFRGFSLMLLLLVIGNSLLLAEGSQKIENCEGILPMRERVKLMEKWWKWKRKHVLPMIMREQGIDMWIIRNGEAEKYYNNQGPIFVSLLPASHEGMAYPSQYLAGQEVPNFLMFYDKGDEIEYVEPRDYAHISELVKQRDPKRIAIGKYNQERTVRYFVGDNEKMFKALGKKYASRSVDSWTLGVRWLETMSPEQISLYRHVQRVANEVIAEAYSNKVVIPDVTTTEDLNWWMIHRYLELGLVMENYPSITITRSDENMAKYDDPPEYFRKGRTSNGINVVIRRGDIIRCDTDLLLLGLETDTHMNAYVLREGETDVPEPLKEALHKVNRNLDKFRKEFKVGRTGKEIVEASTKIIPEEGVITDMVFHPPPRYIRRWIRGGYYFDPKAYVVGTCWRPYYYYTSLVSDNHKLYYNTLQAFGPHVRIAVPGWKHGIRLGIEQICVFTKDGLQYLARSQEHDWYVIK